MTKLEVIVKFDDKVWYRWEQEYLNQKIATKIAHVIMELQLLIETANEVWSQ